MNRTLRCAILSMLLAACGSTSKPPLPDGRNRVPINTVARIDGYHAGRTGPTPMPKTFSETEHRIAVLEARLSALADEAALSPASQLSSREATRSHPADAAIEHTCPQDGLGANETVFCRSRSMVFSLSFGPGTHEIRTTPALRRLLLAAAEGSQRIEVRGRTDAASFSHPDRLLALRRATAARAFLLQHGVDAARIHATALASGGHIADNGTTEGRARNRRVDIEIMDIDPLAIFTTPPISKGEQHEPD